MHTQKINMSVYLQRRCIFGRNGCNGGKDQLRRVVALHELQTSAKTTYSPRKRPCQLDDAKLVAPAAHRNRFTDLRCWWDSTRKQRYWFSQRSEVRNTLDAWLFNSLHVTGVNERLQKEESLTLNLLSVYSKYSQDLALQPTYYQGFWYMINKSQSVRLLTCCSWLSLSHSTAAPCKGQARWASSLAPLLSRWWCCWGM